MRLIISCQPAKFKIPQLSESNFTEVGIRHPQNSYDITSQYLVFKIAHFIELYRSYQPANFIGLGCLDQILRGLVENTPPQTYTLSKSPVLIGLKVTFLGRFITEPEIAPIMKSFFESKLENFFEPEHYSLVVIPNICEVFHEYDLFRYIELWYCESTFPSYSGWKLEKESDYWHHFCVYHPGIQLAQSCLENVHPEQFWYIAGSYPNLVSWLHFQVRLLSLQV